MKKLLLSLALIVGACIGLANIDDGTVKEAEIKMPTFEDAVSIIKQFEGKHTAMHWPFVGYGHLVQKGENFKRGVKLSEKQADALLRSDLKKLCALYRGYGADSLLLGALAYNCGPGVVARSSVLKKLKEGDRDIESAYIAHSRYKGKQLSQLKRRRQTELEKLFVKNPVTLETTIFEENPIGKNEEID